MRNLTKFALSRPCCNPRQYQHVPMSYHPTQRLVWLVMPFWIDLQWCNAGGPGRLLERINYWLIDWYWIWFSSGTEQARDCDPEEEERRGDNLFYSWIRLNFAQHWFVSLRSALTCPGGLPEGLVALAAWMSCAPSLNGWLNALWTSALISQLDNCISQVIQATILSLSVQTSFMYLPFSQCWRSEWKLFKEELFQRLLQQPRCCWRASIWLPRQPAIWKR